MGLGSFFKEHGLQIAGAAASLLPGGGIVKEAATALAGLSNDAQDEDVIKVFEQRPELLAEMKKFEIEKKTDIELALIAERVAAVEGETKQFSEVNQTFRAEIQQEDKFVKRWRPALGWAVSASWFMQMSAISGVIIFKTSEAPAVIAAAASLTALWGIALSVLGVNIKKRSDDKAHAAGVEKKSIIETVAGAFK